MSRLNKRLSTGKTKKKNSFPFNNASNLFYSSFCLTDNKTFAFFYVEDKKIVDNTLIKDLNKFKLNEADLDMIIDKQTLLEPIKGIKDIEFPEIGRVKTDIFEFMKKIYPQCVFHPIQTFFGQAVNSMIIVLQEEYGKPVGLFKTY
jgi:hypothetical protein